jgi:putative hydrolase of the HAD superfamily
MARNILVFDLDDTLYPERQFAVSGFAAAEAWAARELGVRGLAEEMTRLLDDGHLGSLFPVVLGRFAPGHSPEHLEAFIDAYRTHEPRLSLFEDAAAVLEQVAPSGPIGLITDGSHGVQMAKVRALGIEPRFQHIVYTHALGGRAFSKPHPRAFELTEAALGGPGDRFVYIGDNPAKDFVAPNARGWTSVQVERPHRIHKLAETANGGEPQHVIDDLRQLTGVLRTLGD